MRLRHGERRQHQIVSDFIHALIIIIIFAQALSDLVRALALQSHDPVMSPASLARSASAQMRAATNVLLLAGQLQVSIDVYLGETSRVSATDIA